MNTRSAVLASSGPLGNARNPACSPHPWLQIIDSTASAIDGNLSSTEQERKRIEALARSEWMGLCQACLFLVVAVLVFVATYMMIKIVPK